jgi:hypothetical protein
MTMLDQAALDDAGLARFASPTKRLGPATAEANWSVVLVEPLPFGSRRG